MGLVAFVGSDKENLGQISALINRAGCKRVFLIKDKNSPKYFSNSKISFVEIDTRKDVVSLKNEMYNKLKGEFSNELEVYLSLASGSGKEHMALISALLEIPVGVKFIIYTKKGIEFLN